MDSDCMEHVGGYDSGCFSSSSYSEELEDDEARQVDGDDNEDETQLKSIVDLSLDDIMSMEFGSHEEAYEFYVKYARCVGFGVRKAIVGRDDDGNLIRRRFVCSREGLRDPKHYIRCDRKREHKPETRTNCNARLNVYLDKNTLTWKVSRFEEGHNHELTPARFVHLIPNHRRLTDADKAQIDSMQRHGIQTTQIMGFMAGQAGGHARVGFSKKDMFNYIYRQRRAKIKDGDACAAISYLMGKADSDPLMDARYSTIDDERLGNLFWADGLSRVDYEYFGDVLAFDSTYKRNKYNLPLVIFSGSNHHKQICIFGCGLLSDERAETYKWLLEEFLDVMKKKQPSVVVTDGDEAMREAIKSVFPDATHRLCSWHLQKNATSNIKDPKFCDAFKKCIYANVGPEEFEEYWNEMIERFEVHNNNWVQRTYERKEMWANAYLRDKFYAGVRTTSRCEGINAFIRRYVKSRHSILELVQQIEVAVREYRNNEMVADYQSMYTEPVLTTALESIERAAAKVYTREIFFELKQKLEGVAAVVVVGRETMATTVIYRMTMFGKGYREYKVMYDRNLEKFDCECRLFNTHGIPCSHIFCVMRDENVTELPEKMILKRWTKDAKTFVEPVDEEDEDCDKMFVLRYGALCAASMWMSFLAAQKIRDFRETRNEICRITTKLQHSCSLLGTESARSSNQKLGDPVRVKSKGAPRGKKSINSKRRCSNCNMPGHTKRGCAVVRSVKSNCPSSTMEEPSNANDASKNEVVAMMCF